MSAAPDLSMLLTLSTSPTALRHRADEYESEARWSERIANEYELADQPRKARKEQRRAEQCRAHAKRLREQADRYEGRGR